MKQGLPVFERYEAYKDSGVEWLGEIPADWSVIRLQFLADIKVSNVDKDSSSLELPIRLCNYVDVYKNHYITEDIDFMSATATKEEITKFNLNLGDIIITKDSEDWLDIGVPALVKYTEPDLVCGYHLAILRSKDFNLGNFMFWALLAQYTRIQFSNNANGITRYGISSSTVKKLLLAVPSLSENYLSIYNFLDRKASAIKKAIDVKKQQIELLKERKQIIIQQAVTKGLNPTVPMKDSGIEWIGKIPAHWIIKKAKYLFLEVNERSLLGEEELLSVSHMTGVTPRSEKNVSMFMAEDYSGSKLCKANDLIFNIMWAWMGALGVSKQTGIVSPSYGVYRQLSKDSFNGIYLEYLLKTTKYIEHYNRVSTGLHSSRLRFYSHMFFDMKLGFPSKVEQDQIVEYIENQSQKIDTTIQLYQQQIEKLQEYKTTLINHAVTGKIKVPAVN